jgi:hypothetical protein
MRVRISRALAGVKFDPPVAALLIKVRMWST